MKEELIESDAAALEELIHRACVIRDPRGDLEEDQEDNEYTCARKQGAAKAVCYGEERIFRLDDRGEDGNRELLREPYGDEECRGKNDHINTDDEQYFSADVIPPDDHIDKIGEQLLHEWEIQYGAVNEISEEHGGDLAGKVLSQGLQNAAESHKESDQHKNRDSNDKKQIHTDSFPQNS